MPASVEKLYTSATALRRLGPAGRLETDGAGRGGADAAGVVAGRPLPPRRRRPELRRRSTRANLAQQVAEAGIRRGHGPRDRRRVGVRHAPRRAVLGVRAHAPTSAGRSPRSRSTAAAPAAARRTGRPARPTSPPTFFTKQLRHLGVDVAARRPPRRTADRRRAGRRVALAAARRPGAADEPAVGQLHGRDADQGASARGSATAAAPPPAPRSRPRRSSELGMAPADRRRVGPLALGPHVAAATS